MEILKRGSPGLDSTKYDILKNRITMDAILILMFMLWLLVWNSFAWKTKCLKFYLLEHNCLSCGICKTQRNSK